MKNSGDAVSHRMRSRIELARDHAGLSQGDLETSVGIPRGAISKIVSGSRDVSSTELVSIAATCGVSLNWFFEDAEDPMPFLRGSLGKEEARQDLAWFNEFADAFISLTEITSGPSV